MSGAAVHLRELAVDVLLEKVDRRVELGCTRGNIGELESGGRSVVRGVVLTLDLHGSRLDASIPRGIAGLAASFSADFFADGAVRVNDGALVVAGLITAVVAELLRVLAFTFEHGDRETDRSLFDCRDANKN